MLIVRAFLKWGRARAIRDAYFEALNLNGIANPPELSVADIYRWLQDKENSKVGSMGKPQETLTERNSKINSQLQSAQEEGPSGWCQHCGFEEKYHRQALDAMAWVQSVNNQEDKKHAFAQRGPSIESCVILRNVLPTQVLPTSAPLNPAKRAKLTLPQPQSPSSRSDPKRALLHSLDPSLIHFVAQAVKGESLPTFRHLDVAASSLDQQSSLEPTSDPRYPRRIYPIDAFGSTREQVETNLIPYAILAHSLKRFAVKLVEKGLKQAVHEKSLVLNALGASRRGGRKATETVPTLLVPRHLWSGHIDVDSRSSDAPDG